MHRFSGPIKLSVLRKEAGSQAVLDGNEYGDGYCRPGSLGALTKYNVPHRIFAREIKDMEENLPSGVEEVPFEDFMDCKPFSTITLAGVPHVVVENDSETGVMFAVPADRIIVQG